MTNPLLDEASPFAAGVSMAAHIFGPTCFRMNAGTAGSCAASTSVLANRTDEATSATRMSAEAFMRSLDIARVVLVWEGDTPSRVARPGRGHGVAKRDVIEEVFERVERRAM